MHILFVIVPMLLVLLLIFKSNLTKTRKIIFSLLSAVVGIIIILFFYKTFFFGCSCREKNSKGVSKNKENFSFDPEFRFLDDVVNVQANPEIYCGSDLLVPDDYDQMGTRVQCLKKGIGIGMAMPNAQRDAIINRPPTLIGPRPNVYCGNDNVLPPNYTSLGNPYQCLRKGVGAGMRLPDAQRIAFQQRPPRPLGKKEIMNLAKRLGITTHDKTRAQTLTLISERL